MNVSKNRIDVDKSCHSTVAVPAVRGSEAWEESEPCVEGSKTRGSFSQTVSLGRLLLRSTLLCCHCCFGPAGEVVAEMLSVPASRSLLNLPPLLLYSSFVSERAVRVVVAHVGFGVSVDADGMCVAVVEGTIRMRLLERHGQRAQKSQTRREAKE